MDRPRNDLLTMLPSPTGVSVAPSAYPIKLNQKKDCFSLITLDGFVVYQLDPPQVRFRRTFGKSLLLVEALQRTNIVVLVYVTDPNRLIFWDDRQGRVLKEFAFDQDGPILNIKFHNGFLLVVLSQAIVVYQFESFQLVTRISTNSNPLGLVCLHNLDQTEDFLVLAPAQGNPGRVQIVNSRNQIRTFQAHQNPLGQIAISPNGLLIATASKRGTIIRIWSNDNIKDLRSTTSKEEPPQMLVELRRGVESTIIHDIIFHADSQMLCVTGGTGTAHLYCLGDLIVSGVNDEHPNRSIKQKKKRSPWQKAWTRVTKDLPQYLNSQSSLLQISIPPRSLAVFLEQSPEIIFLTPQGQIFKYAYQIDPPGVQQTLFHQLT